MKRFQFLEDTIGYSYKSRVFFIAFDETGEKVKLLKLCSQKFPRESRTCNEIVKDLQNGADPLAEKWDGVNCDMNMLYPRLFGAEHITKVIGQQDWDGELEFYPENMSDRAKALIYA